jgi:HSP20 family protein
MRLPASKIAMDSYRRRSWMWAEALSLLEEAEHKHRHFFELMAVPSPQPAWEPPADIFTDGSELNVVVALPGARAEDITVQMISTGLQIDTVVPPPCVGPAMNVMRLEIPYGRMRRRIELPPGRYSLQERHLDRGCLYLRLTRDAA